MKGPKHTSWPGFLSAPGDHSPAVPASAWGSLRWQSVGEWSYPRLSTVSTEATDRPLHAGVQASRTQRGTCQGRVGWPAQPPIKCFLPSVHQWAMARLNSPLSSKRNESQPHPEECAFLLPGGLKPALRRTQKESQCHSEGACPRLDGETSPEPGVGCPLWYFQSQCYVVGDCSSGWGNSVAGVVFQNGCPFSIRVNAPGPSTRGPEGARPGGPQRSQDGLRRGSLCCSPTSLHGEVESVQK